MVDLLADQFLDQLALHLEEVADHQILNLWNSTKALTIS